MSPRPNGRPCSRRSAAGPTPIAASPDVAHPADSGSHNMLAVDVLEPCVVLPQIIHPVVVAVRRAHHRVDVIPGRFVAVERDAGLMIELDEDHRAVNPVVEDILVARSAHPDEMGAVKMLTDGLQPELGV